ncbi:MAG: hypothetical protein H7A54_14890 [Akkermansiaceae bacterium]|nr:hypothetical protein [Akkermansiaceae bacterium]
MAEEILKPGQELERVFKNVGARVAKSTEQRQEPWSNSKFYGTSSLIREGRHPGSRADPVSSVLPA